MIALIVGGAACVHDDAERALALFTPDVIFAINDQIRDWPGLIDYAVTLHPEKLHNWLPGRAEKQRYMPEVWGHKAERNVDRHTADWAGSSGLFAVKVAIEEDFNRIVLAGVPMDAAAAHYFNPKPWAEVTGFRDAWLRHKQDIAPFVRSMSGFTKDMLGGPTSTWLSAD